MMKNSGVMNRYHRFRGMPIRPHCSEQLVGQNISEKVGQHGGLAAQAHNVGHRGHDRHGDGGLAGRAVDEEIDEALKYQHTDGGKHRV